MVAVARVFKSTSQRQHFFCFLEHLPQIELLDVVVIRLHLSHLPRLLFPGSCSHLAQYSPDSGRVLLFPIFSKRKKMTQEQQPEIIFTNATTITPTTTQPIIHESTESNLGADYWDKFAHFYDHQLGINFIGQFVDSMLNTMFVPNNFDEKRVQILDIGAGTGIVTCKLLEKLNPQPQVDANVDQSNQQQLVHITAIDVADKMLQQLCNKMSKRSEQEQEQHQVTVQNMDACDLQFETNSIDVAFASFVYMFVPDRNKAFAELYRVLKPGAR